MYALWVHLPAWMHLRGCMPHVCACMSIFACLTTIACMPPFACMPTIACIPTFTFMHISACNACMHAYACMHACMRVRVSKHLWVEPTLQFSAWIGVPGFSCWGQFPIPSANIQLISFVLRFFISPSLCFSLSACRSSKEEFSLALHFVAAVCSFSLLLQFAAAAPRGPRNQSILLASPRAFALKLLRRGGAAQSRRRRWCLLLIYKHGKEETEKKPLVRRDSYSSERAVSKIPNPS